MASLDRSPSDGIEDAEALSRPVLNVGPVESADAIRAVERLVDELQAGWDDQDATISNRHFADDIVWGSPFGAAVHGYDQLHAIHTRLKREGMGGKSSRFEIVQMLVPTGDVVVIQIKRVALDPDGQPADPSAAGGPFSEMAMYVLVRRDGTWWVAAGQNTPIRPKPD